MPEYIERERLVKHYENCIDEVKNTNGVTEDFEICLKALKNQPTADVVEVRHGKWNKNGNGRDCSICGFKYYANGGFFNYCPKCGAKMDRKERER